MYYYHQFPSIFTAGFLTKI